MHDLIEGMGFRLVDFTWTSKVDWTEGRERDLPMSRGSLIDGDALYFREVSTLDELVDTDPESAKLALCFLAMSFSNHGLAARVVRSLDFNSMSKDVTQEELLRGIEESSSFFRRYYTKSFFKRAAAKLFAPFL